MTVLNIIYVNFNSTDLLIKSIQTIFDHNKNRQDLQIIVFDNGSNDDPNRVKVFFPRINLILNRKNIGFGAGVNQALSHCHSKYVIFLNPDSLVNNSLIETSVRFMDQHDKIGILGPMIIDEDGSVQGSARAFPSPLTSIFGRNTPITKLFPNNKITRSNILTWRTDNKTPIEVDWVSGACMVARLEAVQAVGGFDTRFFLYWEDTDLCKRIRDKGWKVVYYPKIKITHFVGKSSSSRPIFAVFQFHKSCYKLYAKYTKGPLSILTPLVGIGLMLRFLFAVIFSYSNKALNRVRTI